MEFLWRKGIDGILNSEAQDYFQLQDSALRIDWTLTLIANMPMSISSVGMKVVELLDFSWFFQFQPSQTKLDLSCSHYHRFNSCGPSAYRIGAVNHCTYEGEDVSLTAH